MMRWCGVMSVFVLLLTWAALDDITTDTAQRFDLEYMFLILSGIWFVGIGAWLVLRRRTMLGLATLVAVGIGVPAFWSLPHRGEPVNAVSYLGWVPLLWCAGLTVWQLVTRSHEHCVPGPATSAGDFLVPRTR